MAIYPRLTGKKLGLIKGDVTAEQFEDWIDVTSVHFGQARPVHVQKPTGNPVVSELMIHKRLDKASVLLGQIGFIGDLAVARFDFVREGADHATFMRVDLANAIISRYEFSTDYESISFSFTRLEYTWMDGGIMSSWDLTTT